MGVYIVKYALSLLNGWGKILADAILGKIIKREEGKKRENVTEKGKILGKLKLKGLNKCKMSKNKGIRGAW